MTNENYKNVKMDRAIMHVKKIN